MMDVDQENKRIVSISQRSKTPLKYVPYMILYANGRPIAQFFPDEDNPESNYEKMRAFLVKQTAKQPQQAAEQRTIQDEKERAAGIPPYSLGIPGNYSSRRKTCYIGFNSAYAGGANR
jgi:hypothetical protein